MFPKSRRAIRLMVMTEIPNMNIKTLHRYRSAKLPQPLGQQQGFALVIAVFLIVVISAALTTMTNQTGGAVHYQSLNMLGQRAYYSAQSGIDWGLYQITTTSACPADNTITLTSGASDGFVVNVTCTSEADTEGGTAVTSYELSSTAEYGSYESSSDYVSKSVSVSFVL